MSGGTPVYCTQCGAAGSGEDLFCRQCGARRGGSASRQPGLETPGKGSSPEGARFTAPPSPSPGLFTHPGVHQPSEPVNSAPDVPYSPPPFNAAGPRTLAYSGIPPTGSLAPPPPLLPVVPQCGICQRPLPMGASQCPSCGASRALVSVGTCFRCGAGNPASNRYCGRCGGLLISNALSSQRSSASALPVVGSLILPGLGQMMNGEAMKGFMLLGAALLMISLTQGPIILNPVYLLVTAIAAIDAALGQSRRERHTYQTRDWA